MAMIRFLTLAGLLHGACGHGQLVNPRPRNSLDYLLTPHGGEGPHACSNMTGAACRNGQSAFWYSQGCFIGCPTCDHTSGRRQTDLCGLGMQPTNNGDARSLNRYATPQAPDDIYQHNPWRAPGTAPVADACGLAGGTPWGWNVSEAGLFINSSLAHHGMRGTALPRMPTGTMWIIGGFGNVSWNVQNNHVGSARTCPPAHSHRGDRRLCATYEPPLRCLCRASAGRRLLIQALPSVGAAHRVLLPAAPARVCNREAGDPLPQRHDGVCQGHLPDRGDASCGLDVVAAAHPSHRPRPSLPAGAPRHQFNTQRLHGVGGALESQWAR